MKRCTVLIAIVVAGCSSSQGGGTGGHSSGTGGEEPTPTGGKPGGPDGGGGKGGPDASAMDSGPTATCAGGQHTLVCEPMMKMPRSIKDTGVYPALPDLSKHAEQLIAYSPEPALWSDGLSKERFLLLPAGTKIDNGDPKKWVFPQWTVFVKSFFADNKIVETRFVRRNEQDLMEFPFEYYTYKWNAEGTDAVMEGWMDGATFEPRDAQWKPDPVAVTLQGKPHMHPIPGKDDCGGCHDENRGLMRQGMGFIGFDEIRLNSTLPGATQPQLQALAAKGLFTKPPGAATIKGTSEVETRVMRFVYGNCVHCHNDPMGNDSPMDLHPEVLVAQTRNVAIMGHIEAPPGFKRVIPGKPLMSVVYVQAARIAEMINKQYSTPTKQYMLRDMPPVGVSVVPSSANGFPEGDPVKDLFDWITALK